MCSRALEGGDAVSFSLRKILGRGTGLCFMNLLFPVSLWAPAGKFLKAAFSWETTELDHPASTSTFQSWAVAGPRDACNRVLVLRAQGVTWGCCHGHRSPTAEAPH